MTRRFAFGPFLLDAARGTLTRDGAALAVGQRGLRILLALLDAQGEVVNKASLMALAWPGLVVEDSNLTVQVAALRKLLGTRPDGSDWIVTAPRLGYRLVGALAVEETNLEPIARAAADPGGRPTIAVLPFVNLSDDSAQEYFADGVTEDIIAALTRFRWFSVTGRNASHVYKVRRADTQTVARELGVRYVVEGSVRKLGERVRLSVALVDATSGQCLWADHHDFEIPEVFEVQDSIAQRVAGAIEPELLKSAGGLAASRRSGSVTGWDLVAQGSWFFHHVTRPTHFRARELFRQACQVDPELTEARLWIGRVDAGIVAYGWSEDPAEDLREGVAMALQAVQMDEKSPYAHYALAIVSVYTQSFNLAIRSAEKAIELNPSFALGHLVHGMASLYAGDARGAVASLERGLWLNRYDPQNFIWYHVLALAYLFTDRMDDALQRAVAALKIRPTWRPAMQTAAACCAALGQTDAAGLWIRQMAALPSPAGDALQPLWQSRPHWAAQMQQWLAAASS